LHAKLDSDPSHIFWADAVRISVDLDHGRRFAPPYHLALVAKARC
jgi:hypothetical protein